MNKLDKHVVEYIATRVVRGMSEEGVLGNVYVGWGLSIVVIRDGYTWTIDSHLEYLEEAKNHQVWDYLKREVLWGFNHLSSDPDYVFLQEWEGIYVSGEILEKLEETFI